MKVMKSTAIILILSKRLFSSAISRNSILSSTFLFIFLHFPKCDWWKKLAFVSFVKMNSLWYFANRKAEDYNRSTWKADLWIEIKFLWWWRQSWNSNLSWQWLYIFSQRSPLQMLEEWETKIEEARRSGYKKE